MPKTLVWRQGKDLLILQHRLGTAEHSFMGVIRDTLVSLGTPALGEWMEMDLQVKPACMEPAQQLKTFCFTVFSCYYFLF